VRSTSDQLNVLQLSCYLAARAYQFSVDGEPGGRSSVALQCMFVVETPKLRQ
jgi:hypothetical protein